MTAHAAPGRLALLYEDLPPRVPMDAGRYLLMQVGEGDQLRLDRRPTATRWYRPRHHLDPRWFDAAVAFAGYLPPVVAAVRSVQRLAHRRAVQVASGVVIALALFAVGGGRW